MPSIGIFCCLCLRLKFANSGFQRSAAEGEEIDSEDELDIDLVFIFSLVSKTGCLEDLVLDYTTGAAGDGGIVWFPLCPSDDEGINTRRWHMILII